jgi:signal transduction histidine kinase
MRLLIYQLRPPVLEKEGLLAALQNRLYSVENRAGLKTNIQSNLEERLPPAVEEGLFRIALEALNNTLKHAHARNVQVGIRSNEGKVSMDISDDGVGFDPETACHEGCLGIISMRERALAQGWNFDLESKPGAGTRVHVEVNQ